MIYLRYRIS